MSTGKSIARILIASALLAGLAACGGGVYKPFNPTDEKQAIRPASVAVIAGSHQDGDIRLAEFLTKQISDRTKFRVLSQAEIGKRIPGYPATTIAIKEDKDIKDGDEKVVWFRPSEKAKLDAIQSRLNVDYVYVVWVPWMRVVSSQNGSTYYVYPAGNLIAYPGTRVVASTRMGWGESNSILALFRSKDYYIVKALENSAEAIVDDMITAASAVKK